MTTAYLHGEFYTVNSNQPWAEALLVHDGVITAVGTNDEIGQRVTDDTEVIDLAGRMGAV
jgi:hypothetical protein